MQNGGLFLFLQAMTVGELIAELERAAPPALQEDYDNSGLLTGHRAMEASGALLCLDCTEAVVDEAIALGCNLVVAHHPLVFSGLKRFTGASYVERTLIKAIKHDVAIYACHTNLDNVHDGVNLKISEKLGLRHPRVLLPKNGGLKKLVTYVPPSHHAALLEALFGAGAGHIGNYDQCSFTLEGTGTFRGNANSQPFTGSPGELSREKELRIETVFPAHLQTGVLAALAGHHPYEEVAYDVYALDIAQPRVGSGMLGELDTALRPLDFLNHVKRTFKAPVLRHTAVPEKNIRKVAVCGGSGRFLLKHAIAQGADAYITADFKYHEFFDADGRILLIDTGHYESEQFTPEIFYSIIQKKFAKFAVHLSKIHTNPINYF